MILDRQRCLEAADILKQAAEDKAWTEINYGQIHGYEACYEARALLEALAYNRPIKINKQNVSIETYIEEFRKWANIRNPYNGYKEEPVWREGAMKALDILESALKNQERVLLYTAMAIFDRLSNKDEDYNQAVKDFKELLINKDL